MSKPKPVNWEMIATNSTDDGGLYDLCNTLIKQYHSGDKGIEGVNCLFMWRHNIKPDQDGYVYMADVAKSTDKVRELIPHDFIIGVNKLTWNLLNDKQKSVLIDSQLERIAKCFDKEGHPKEDDKARPLYRLRRLEVLDDHTMNRRHVMNLNDVQQFAFDHYQKLFKEEEYLANQAKSDSHV